MNQAIYQVQKVSGKPTSLTKITISSTASPKKLKELGVIVDTNNLVNVTAKIFVISGTLGFSTESNFAAGEGMFVGRGVMLELNGWHEISNFFFRSFENSDTEITVLIERS